MSRLIGLVQPFHASCRNADYDGRDEKKGGAAEAADSETERLSSNKCLQSNIATDTSHPAPSQQILFMMKSG